jgi:hypothetical protein
MNIIDLQERLKDLPEEALMQEMQMPTGSAPQFLVLSELKRRKRMRDDYQRMQASDMKTVAEETITAAGMPQSGIMGVAQAMAPKSAIAQDTGLNDMQQMDPTQAPQPEQPMMMADGGYVDDARRDRLDMLREEVLARDALGLPEDTEYMSRARAEGDQTISDISPIISDYMPENAMERLYAQSLGGSGPARRLGYREGDQFSIPEDEGDGLRLKDRMIKSIFGELLSEEDAGQTELPMDTGTPLEVPEDGVGSLLPPARQEVAPDIATSDAGAGTGAGPVGGARGGAGGGGGAFGSIEGRIAKMLEERDRSAQADKWLALAQTGLALMSSTQPTIGGAIGEAGLAGIGAMRDARSQYDEDILKLLGAQSDIEQYKDARRLAATKASRGSGASLDKAIDNARQEINMLYREAASYRQIVTDPVTAEAKLVEMIPPGLQARIVAAEDRLDALNRLGSSGEQVMFDATQTQ